MKPSLEEKITEFFNDSEFKEAWDGFVKMRVKINKPFVTQRMVNRAINRLMKLSKANLKLAIEIVDQSAYECWQDLWPIKDDKNTTQNYEPKKDYYTGG